MGRKELLIFDNDWTIAVLTFLAFGTFSLPLSLLDEGPEGALDKFYFPQHARPILKEPLEYLDTIPGKCLEPEKAIFPPEEIHSIVITSVDTGRCCPL